MSTRKYKDDYEIVFTVDKQGREKREVRYRGNFYEISLDQAALLQFKRRSILLLAGIFGLHLSGGFLNNPGMYQFYISLPYVIVFFPLVYLAEGIFRMPKEKRGYRRDEKELSFERIKTASIALIVIIGIGLIGEIIFLLFFSEPGHGVLEFRYLILEILATSFAIVLIRLVQPIHFQLIPDS